MIPDRVEGLAELAAEAERQGAEVEEIFAEQAPEALVWRPDESRWSITGHVAHLVIIDEAYLGSIDRVVSGARASGSARSDGPYRHPRITTWFAGTMEPPPKRRLKTFRSMVPDPGTSPDEALADFLRLQVKTTELLHAARGLDLGKVRFGSPFFAPLRFSLGTGFATVLAHNRRHIWLAREVAASPGFAAADRSAPEEADGSDDARRNGGGGE